MIFNNFESSAYKIRPGLILAYKATISTRNMASTEFRVSVTRIWVTEIRCWRERGVGASSTEVSREEHYFHFAG